MRLILALLLILPALSLRAQPGIIPYEVGPQPAEFAGLLEAHNTWRSREGIPPLQWSPTAQRQAEGWARQLAAEGCQLRFNPDPARRQNWGENLYRSFSSQPYEGYRRLPDEVVERWGGEGVHYDAASGRCSARSCGQFTQLMWETTRVVGCARARCPTAEVWVCNYTPRGNVEGLKAWGNSAEALSRALNPPEPVVVPATVAGECPAAPGWNAG